MRLSAALLVSASIQAFSQEPAPRVITGTVRDSADGPVSYAIIQKTGQSRVVSDDSGRFEYRAPPKGQLTITVRRLGYVPFELKLAPGGDTTLRIVLASIPRHFDAVNVEASRLSRRLEAAGFYERLIDRNKGLGSGTFITIEDIEQRSPLRISQMLEGINGVRVFKYGGGFDEFEIRGPGQCQFTVYLNGTRIGPRISGHYEPVRVDALVEPSAVSGIEVYPRASGAPPHLQMLNGTCGVVAFWTK